TSGSVSPYQPITYSSLASFAQGVDPSREAVQLLAFNEPAPRWLLPYWSSDTERVQRAITEWDRNADSSNSELALLTATRALAGRLGGVGGGAPTRVHVRDQLGRQRVPAAADAELGRRERGRVPDGPGSRRLRRGLRARLLPAAQTEALHGDRHDVDRRAARSGHPESRALADRGPGRGARGLRRFGVDGSGASQRRAAYRRCPARAGGPGRRRAGRRDALLAQGVR